MTGQQSHDVISRSSHRADLIRPIRERLSGSSGLILALRLRTQQPCKTQAGKSSRGAWGQTPSVNSSWSSMFVYEWHLRLRDFWSTSDWSHYLVRSQRARQDTSPVCLWSTGNTAVLSAQHDTEMIINIQMEWISTCKKKRSEFLKLEPNKISTPGWRKFFILYLKFFYYFIELMNSA